MEVQPVWSLFQFQKDFTVKWYKNYWNNSFQIQIKVKNFLNVRWKIKFVCKLLFCLLETLQHMLLSLDFLSIVSLIITFLQLLNDSNKLKFNFASLAIMEILREMGLKISSSICIQTTSSKEGLNLILLIIKMFQMHFKWRSNMCISRFDVS